MLNETDRAVLANAYVSGMREDVGLTGNEYNLLVTCLSGTSILTASLRLPRPVY